MFPMARKFGRKHKFVREKFIFHSSSFVYKNYNIHFRIITTLYSRHKWEIKNSVSAPSTILSGIDRLVRRLLLPDNKEKSCLLQSGPKGQIHKGSHNGGGDRIDGGRGHIPCKSKFRGGFSQNSKFVNISD